MSLSASLANGRDHDKRARGHVQDAWWCEEDAWHSIEHRCYSGALRDIHAARLEWAMAVCAMLAWVQVGGES